LDRLNHYERRSLLRFLALYLGSVFLLLAIIGWLFFEHNASVMKSAMKFEMLSEAHRIESSLIQILMRRSVETDTQLKELLKGIGSRRFKVGFFDAKHRPIYSEIGRVPMLEHPFYFGTEGCYSMIRCPLKKHGIAYIGLQDTRLEGMIRQLRLKILGYLTLSFLFMALVGWALARLFMRPIREKIEALDRFIEETTHELNTPISAILMTIQQLRGVEEKKLARLKASAKRLSTMYDTLSYGLDRESGPKQSEWIALERFILERMEEMRPLFESRNIVMSCRLEPCRIRMSRENLRRMLDNLLTNAVKYSDPGGRVELRLERCIVVIRDEGIGMDREASERIFKRYERANHERGGFGIGLSIVAQICLDYGIGWELDTAPGKGTEFRFDFSMLSK
jgi:two-component system OmpR family sensor kinase